jgi:hypothetical protein
MLLDARGRARAFTRRHALPHRMCAAWRAATALTGMMGVAAPLERSTLRKDDCMATTAVLQFFPE